MPVYTTVAQVKLYRGIPTANTADDALLTALIAGAVTAIDSYCGRSFAAPSTAATRYFDAVRDTSDDRRTLYLDDDLASVTSIVNAGTTVATTHYVTEPRNATPYYAIRLNYLADDLWTWQTSPEDAISVTGRWGYATAAPADIQHAAVRLAAYYYAQKDASTFDVTFYGGGEMTIPQGIPADVRIILDHYRKIN